MSYDNWLTAEPDHWYSCAKMWRGIHSPPIRGRGRLGQGLALLLGRLPGETLSHSLGVGFNPCPLTR